MYGVGMNYPISESDVLPLDESPAVFAALIIPKRHYFIDMDETWNYKFLGFGFSVIGMGFINS